MMNNLIRVYEEYLNSCFTHLYSEQIINWNYTRTYKSIQNTNNCSWSVFFVFKSKLIHLKMRSNAMWIHFLWDQLSCTLQSFSKAFHLNTHWNWLKIEGKENQVSGWMLIYSNEFLVKKIAKQKSILKVKNSFFSSQKYFLFIESGNGHKYNEI